MDQQIQLLLRRLDDLSGEFRELQEGVQKVVQIAKADPEMALTRVRKVLEYLIRDVYKRRCGREPKTQSLESLLQQLVKDRHLPTRIDAYANMIRNLGNVGTHGFGEKVSEKITIEDVQASLNQLLPILLWYFEVERPEAVRKAPDPYEQTGQEEEEKERLRAKEENTRRLKEEEAQRRDEELEQKRLEAEELKLPVEVEKAGVENKERAAEEIERRPAAEPVPANMTNGIGMEFVWIPPGSFMMGSENGSLSKRFLGDEKPVHLVNFAEGFYMGKYQVTQAQWQQIIGNNPSHFKGANLPAEQIKWNPANAFCARLNELNDGYTYRLPSEAEWEYACRSGTTGEYAGDLDAMAWYSKNSGNMTHPVGSKLPNAFGLFDMHGNVWEWCQDWYHNSYSYSGVPTDGSAWLAWNGPDKPKFRVVRGGSWNYKASFCRSAYRLRFDPDWRVFTYVGLRVIAVART